MDKWTRIRRDVLVEKISRREACRKYNLNFRTIQKILEHPEPPKKPKEYARARPKLGPFISVIHEILEADKKVHPKQRHTGKRIFDRLRDEHGYTGGITVVRDEIRRSSSRRPKSSCRWRTRRAKPSSTSARQGPSTVAVRLR